MKKNRTSKKDLQAQLDAIRRSLAHHVQREKDRQERAESAFSAALTELSNENTSLDGRVITCITPNGRMFRARVTEIEVDYGMVDVTRAPEFGGSRWREFMPGMRTVTMTILPEPLEM